MKHIIAIATVFLAACSSVDPKRVQPAPIASNATSSASAAPAAAPAREEPVPVVRDAPPIDGLKDLGAMTFRCPQAGLNAAAREAAKVTSQGRYQFAYFKLIDDSHHASYEIHFKSNQLEEPDLKYCVSVYCQQGQDPAAGVKVKLIGSDAQPTHARAGDAAHGPSCGHPRKNTQGPGSKPQSKKR
jgi:hypothetical protein